MNKRRGAVLALLALILAGQLFSLGGRAAAGLELNDPVRLNDMVLSLLTPTIQEAVDRYYEPYLSSLPTVVPFTGMTIIGIQGGEDIHRGSYNSSYTVTVEVLPYIGPHNSVGRDRVEIEISPMGVRVSSFQHLESFDLHEWDQPIIQAPLP